MEVDDDVAVPMELPFNLENLKSHGITHILCVRQDVEARYVKVNFPQDFVYKVMEMRDRPNESIITKFPEARDFIKGCLAGGGKILIHGFNGMSRSGALLTAYIMESSGLTFEQASQIIKRRRYCVAVNHGFKNQLIEYEPIYRARMSMMQTDARPGVSLKRRASDDGHNLNVNQH